MRERKRVWVRQNVYAWVRQRGRKKRVCVQVKEKERV